MRQQRLSYGGDTMLIVQKFGGTSLEGRERIFAAARIITQAAKRAAGWWLWSPPRDRPQTI